MKKSLLIILFFFSCTSTKQFVIYAKIVSSPIKTMRGFKYYIVYENKFDSTYQNSDQYILNEYYPFIINHK